jgi:hypothetical protein
MPETSRLFGIIIAVYYSDNAPPHSEYQPC